MLFLSWQITWLGLHVWSEPLFEPISFLFDHAKMRDNIAHPIGCQSHQTFLHFFCLLSLVTFSLRSQRFKCLYCSDSIVIFVISLNFQNLASPTLDNLTFKVSSVCSLSFISCGKIWIGECYLIFWNAHVFFNSSNGVTLTVNTNLIHRVR